MEEPVIYQTEKRPAEMTIAFKDGNKIITHPTGVEQKIDVKALEQFKLGIEQQIAQLEEMLIEINNDIKAAQATIVEVKT